MKKITFCQIFFLLSLSLNLFSQTNDNAELKKMYEEDQRSRSVPNIDWSKLSKEDDLREKRVYELIDSGKIITGKDYYHSAMIFQHGKDSLAHGMAVKQMRKAIALDSTINRWLLAAAIDRSLMSRGEPQIYGTQYMKEGQDSPWKRYTIDSTKATDEERKFYHVETLAEQREKERNMNLLSLSEYYAKTNSLEKTVELIKAEKEKGNRAKYNVTESEINSFGYELMNSNKVEEALVIFTLNTKLYPNGFNTFDSLGECLLKLNRKEESINAYKKSLELNPKNENATKVLSEIK
jgi:tetratricopeptide (TPR) repeat protein